MGQIDLAYLGIRTLPPSLLIDTNLFVLYVVGSIDRSRIRVERATRKFTEKDFELLASAMTNFQEVRVTPNVLTETDNLLDRTRDPFRTQVREGLAEILPELQERYVRSLDAAQIPQFVRVGLADAATVEASRNDCPVLTDDLDLYLALQEIGTPSLNFNHLRSL